MFHYIIAPLFELASCCRSLLARAEKTRWPPCSESTRGVRIKAADLLFAMRFCFAAPDTHGQLLTNRIDELKKVAELCKKAVAGHEHRKIDMGRWLQRYLRFSTKCFCPI